MQVFLERGLIDLLRKFDIEPYTKSLHFVEQAD